MKKKLVLFITLIFTLVVSVFGLIACGDSDANDDRDARIVSVYNMYVAIAEENGKTPLSYEEWIKSIKGEKGDKGDRGEKGQDGAVDVGISDITIDNNGDLIVTLSNGQEINAGNVIENNPQGLDFYPLPDGTYAVGVGKAKFLNKIVIPAEYNGKKITSIGKDAFRECDSITSITMPDSVKSIGNMAFAGLYYLTSIVIPDSVESIGYGAFYYCTSLGSVYYKGTATEWDNITIYGSNEYLINAARYYYSETQQSGNYWHYVNGVPTVWE